MKKLLFVSILSFVFNFLWEIAQASLYAPHFKGVGGLISVHIIASLGDVLLVFLIFWLTARITKYIPAWEARNKRLFLMALVGAIIAVLVERYALGTGRWSYNSLMPVIPIFHVGLTPIMQMIIIPPVLFALSKKYPFSVSA